MILLDSTLNEIDFNSIVSEGRVLCINFSHLQNDLYHLEYLHPLLHNGLDKIVAISSVSNIHHKQISIYFPDVITLSDPNYLWFQHLKNTQNLNNSLDTLSHSLKCQQLWVDGEINNFWHQSVDNQLAEFYRLKKYNSFKQFGKEGVNWLTSLKKENMIQLFNSDTDFSMNCDLKENDYSFLKFAYALKWYKLIPNNDLEKALVN